MELNIYKDKSEVAIKFSEYLIKKTESEKEFHVALSGGSTPKIVFNYLADNFKNHDWSNVHFYWGDERCVAPDHSESNYKMTVDHLFSKVKVPKENIHRILGENSPEKEAVRYSNILNSQLPHVNSIPQFNLVILGMGNDGHTASIFPHEIELWNSAENCVVAVHPDSGQKRISITGKIINNAAETAFLVTGTDKKEMIPNILKLNENSHQYPATLVAPVNGKLIWFLDKAATENL